MKSILNMPVTTHLACYTLGFFVGVFVTSRQQNAPAPRQRPEARSTLLKKGSTMVRVRESANGVHVGCRFGKWEVIGPPFSRGRTASTTAWSVVARCDCGRIDVIRCTHAAQGKTAKCKPCMGAENAIHGAAQSKSVDARLYRIWHAMKARCRNPNNSHFDRYGGRGIAVCKQWAASFVVFREWSRSNGYDDTREIDRIDNDGSYGPDNCRWVTRRENILNSTHARMVTAFGETKPMVEWSYDSRCIVTKELLRSRLRTGWDAQVAMTTPKMLGTKA